MSSSRDDRHANVKVRYLLLQWVSQGRDRLPTGIPWVLSSKLKLPPFSVSWGKRNKSSAVLLQFLTGSSCITSKTSRSQRHYKHLKSQKDNFSSYSSWIHQDYQNIWVNFSSCFWGIWLSFPRSFWGSTYICRWVETCRLLILVSSWGWSSFHHSSGNWALSGQLFQICHLDLNFPFFLLPVLPGRFHLLKSRACVAPKCLFSHMASHHYKRGPQGKYVKSIHCVSFSRVLSLYCGTKKM